MTDIQELLSQIPVQQIASMLGTDNASAQAAVEAAVPTLLAGLQNNVQAPDGAAALESELARHRNGLADGGADPAQVDTRDGEKIVGHVFGGQQDEVVNRLAGTANLGGVGGDLVRKLLPILAPIVMSGEEGPRRRPGFWRPVITGRWGRNRPREYSRRNHWGRSWRTWFGRVRRRWAGWRPWLRTPWVRRPWRHSWRYSWRRFAAAAVRAGGTGRAIARAVGPGAGCERARAT
jgi:hypothetical protein